MRTDATAGDVEVEVGPELVSYHFLVPWLSEMEATAVCHVGRQPVGNTQLCPCQHRRARIKELLHVANDPGRKRGAGVWRRDFTFVSVAYEPRRTDAERQTPTSDTLETMCDSQSPGRCAKTHKLCLS